MDDTLTRLREGKNRLRNARIAMSLPEKVKEVVELQKIAVTTLSRLRTLGELERVWPLRELDR